jgi:predicted RecA/RadA family phage recombinase
MAFECQFVSGQPVMVDHTPGVAVAAGEVVVTGDTTRIAHLPIPVGQLGALAAEGGIYKTKGAAIIAVDKKIYWDNAANRATENAAAGANKPLGVTVTPCAAVDGECSFRHDPAI